MKIVGGRPGTAWVTLAVALVACGRGTGPGGPPDAPASPDVAADAQPDPEPDPAPDSVPEPVPDSPDLPAEAPAPEVPATWFDRLCFPCLRDVECRPGGVGRCASRGIAGSFCEAPCVAGGCPDGYACEGDADGSWCRPAGGACACPEVAPGYTPMTLCGAAVGRCVGIAACGPGGLGPCSADTPGRERCNGLDDDCDGDTDEGLPCERFYEDADGDGFGVDGTGKCLCAGWYLHSANRSGDCDDRDDAVHPWAGPGFPVPAACGSDGDCDGEPVDVGEECDDANDVEWDGCGACRPCEVRVAGQGDGFAGPPAIAAAPDGRLVVAWLGSGDGGCPHARRYDPAGVPIDASALPLYDCTGASPAVLTDPAVAVFPDGSSVVAFATGGVVVRRLPPSGPLPPEGMHVCCQPDAWGGVVAAAIPDGRVALAWTRYAGEGGVFRVAGAVLDAGGEFHVFDPSPAAAGSEEPTGIAAWAGGDVAIARDTKEGEERVARVRWYAADGTPRAADTRLDPAAEAWAASIAALPDGRTVAVWVAPRGSAGGTTIVARAFAPDGTPGTAFVPAQWTFGDLDRPTVAAGGGGATFAWIRRFALGSDVWARPYTTAPAPAGDETLMNVHEGGTHDAPAAAARDGGSVVAWHASGSVPGVFFRFTGGSR